MVARTTPARRAISAMLASGSVANASSAASRIEAMLRSASARLRLLVEVALGLVLGMASVDRHCLWREPQLRQKMPGRREHDQCDQACHHSEATGPQEPV